MRALPLFVSCIFAAGISGCALHPIPDDVTHISTFEIVQKIRCEAANAIRRYATDKNGNLVGYLREAAIGYDFNLAMTEDNDGSGSATFTLPFSNGRFTLGVGLGQDKQRKNERNFKLADKFSVLIDSPHLHNCALHKNWRYPIAGNVGLDEVLKTFAEISELRKFDIDTAPRTKKNTGAEGGSRQFRAAKPSGGQPRGDGPSGDQPSGRDGPGGSRSGIGSRLGSLEKNVVAFTEVLTFTTTYNGSLSPSVSINPVANRFKLTQASASLGAERKDVHRLTIALALGEKDQTQRYLRFFPGAPDGRSPAENQVLDLLRRQEDKGFQEDFRDFVRPR